MSDSTDTQSLLDYLSSPVESPADAAPEEGLQSTPDGLDAGQSDAGQEGLASQPDPAQTEPDTEPAQAETPDDGRLEAAVSPAEEAATQLSAEEIAHLRAEAEKAQAFERALDMARQQREAEAQRNAWKQGFEALANGDVDDDKVEPMTEALISHISQFAASRTEAQLAPQIAAAQRERDSVLTALTSVVASIKAVAPDAESRILAEHQKRVRQGSSSDIERTFTLEQQLRSEANAEVQKLRGELTALRAQIAGKGLDATKVYNTEGGAQNGGEKQYDSLSDYLRDGPL